MLNPFSRKKNRAKPASKTVSAPASDDNGTQQPVAEPPPRATKEHPNVLLSEALSQKADLLESSNRLHRRAVLGLVASNLVLGVAAVAGFSRETEYKYFYATEGGKVFEDVPLDEPLFSQAAIRNFLTSSIAELFSFHYRNVEMRLQRYAHTVMTEAAFRDMVSELDRINLVGAMRERREVAVGAVTDAPVLVASGTEAGVRTWEYAMQLAIVLEGAQNSSTSSSRGETRRLTGQLRAQLIRVPPEEHPRGVLINRLQIVQGGNS